MNLLKFGLPVTVALSQSFCALAFSPVNVLTYHNDAGRTGQNLNESILSPVNVGFSTFGRLFSYTVDGYVYAQPLYVSGITIPGTGTHNLLIIATEHNSVYAFDADRNSGAFGGLLWQTNLGPTGLSSSKEFGTRYGGVYSDIQPEVGITGTPVIDLASGTLYVDAFTHEGGSYYHHIHALNITNGLERPFGPVLVSASVPGTGVGGDGSTVPFVPQQELQRGALTLAGGMLYVTYNGYADTDPYHGWILGFDASTLQLLPNYIFNTTPNATTGEFGVNAGEGGIWMGGNGLAVDTDTNVYVEVGNGSFNALNGAGGTEFADSFLKFSTAGGLVITDYFTPYDQASMAAGDQDLGSGGMILIPDQPGPYAHLMAGAGKGGNIYLINRDQMTTDNGHYNASGAPDHIIQTVSGQTGPSFDTPAYFNGRIFYAGNGNRLKAFTLSPTTGLLSTTPVSTGPRNYSFPGSTPCVSADGTNNGIVWAVQMGSPAVLTASNPTNLTTELYNSSQAAGNRDRLANGVKFVLPTIANGKVYVGGQYSVSAFGLLDPYLNWKYGWFGANATNAGVAGDLADPDGDGAPNLLEFALASDPTVVNPTGSISGAISNNQFEVQFDRNTTATNITYVVQTADALYGPWTDLMTYTVSSGWTANVAGSTASESVPNSIPPNQYVFTAVVDPTLVTGASVSDRFYRLLVHR
jgi:hypothetical protein